MSEEQHKKECIDLNISSTLDEVASEESAPTVVPAPGPVLMHVPVTLAQRTVSTTLSANIHFDDPVLEIKDVKKRVKIVQCSLMLRPTDDPTEVFVPEDAHLFIRGFVRKNFQFASPTYRASDNCVSSEMRSHTIDLPFELSTIIPAADFISPPQRPLLNTRSEFDFFRSQKLGKGFPEKDRFLSSDLSQFHQISTQHYNQFPFCELISSEITEWDEAIDRKPLHGEAPFEEGYFHDMVEKMFLTFTIKVLQNQQAFVTVAMTPPTTL
ncbi:CsxC family protein [Niallia oryzisoli]|uniref:CsxC family protein n=1 Tax=Niallia oryzisoli TaxID=1737571 RepID=UPI003736A33E